MPYSAGTAYVQIKPTTDNISAQIAAPFKKSGEEASSLFSSSFGKTVLGGAVMGVAASAASKIGSMFSSSLNAGIERTDLMNNFPNIMKNLGYSAEEAQASVNKLADGVKGMPTSLPDITNLAQQLTPLCSNLDEATDLSLAFNNMLLASGKPMADQSRAMTQFTQALAKGKPDMMDWRTLQEVMPAQLTQVAKAMLGASATSNDLGEALRDGTIPMTDFADAIMNLNESGDGFTGFADQAKDATKGIGTALANVDNAFATFWQKVLNGANAEKIAGVINGFSDAVRNAGDVVANVVGLISDNFDIIKSAVAGLAFTIGTVKFAAFMQQLITGSNFLGTLGEKVSTLTGKIDSVRGKLSEAGNATKVFGNSAAQSSGNVGKLGDAAGKTGQAAGSSWKNMLAFGGAVLMIGGGIAIAAFGISTLANGIATLAQQGAGALATLVIIVGVIAGLGIALGIATPFISAAGTGMLIFGGACLMIGGAILLIGAGIWLICQGLVAIVQQFPLIVQYGVQATAILAMFSAVLFPLAGGLLLVGAGMVVLGAGLLVAGVGALVLGVGLLVAMPGLLIASMTLPIIAATAMPAAMGLMQMAGAAMMLMGSLIILPIQLGILMAVLFGFAAVVAGAAFAIGLSMLSFGAFADACQRMGDGMGTAMWAAENLADAINSMTSNARSAIDDFNGQLDNLASHAKQVCDQIKATFNTMELRIPSPRLEAMPHFRVSGAFDLASGQVPRIDVDWYARGGVFGKPSIIGVGDARSREIVTPEALMSDIVGAEIDKKQGADAAAVIGWLSQNLPGIISDYTPVMGQKTFDRKVRKAVAYV